MPLCQCCPSLSCFLFKPDKHGRIVLPITDYMLRIGVRHPPTRQPSPSVLQRPATVNGPSDDVCNHLDMNQVGGVYLVSCFNPVFDACLILVFAGNHKSTKPTSLENAAPVKVMVFLIPICCFELIFPFLSVFRSNCQLRFVGDKAECRRCLRCRTCSLKSPVLVLCTKFLTCRQLMSRTVIESDHLVRSVLRLARRALTCDNSA
jgi:hypothetical protein